MTEVQGEFRLLVVDDEEGAAEDTEEILRQGLADRVKLAIEREEEFDRAEQRLENEDFDLVVLDVRDGGSGPVSAEAESRGARLYERVRGIRWIPVVFFTAVPNQVRGLEDTPLVQVVAKGGDDDDLVAAVRAGLSSNVVTVTRELHSLVETEVRGFLRDIVAPNWRNMAAADKQEIALVITNRLAASLKENAVRRLGGVLDGKSGSTIGHHSAARAYLLPPVTRHPTAADIVQDPEKRWWVVLTPACDLYEDPPESLAAKPWKAKATYVRLAKAELMDDQELVRTFRANPTRKNREALERAFSPRHNRYWPLPRYLDVPDLLVDFEHVSSVPLDEVRGWRRVATLDSPFAEALLTAHSQTVGRVGYPDLSFDGLLEELGVKNNRRAQKPVPRQRPEESSSASS